jgi:hypothetical protein
MRIQFDVDTRPRRIGRLMKRALDQLGYEFQLKHTYHFTARMYGYRDWIDLLHNLGAAPPTAFDADIDPETAAARRTQYIAALIEAGVRPDDAGQIIDEIGPTRSGACCRAPVHDDEQPICAPRVPREAVVVYTKRRSMRPGATGKIRTFNLDRDDVGDEAV